jgi:hypothetical protein
LHNLLMVGGGHHQGILWCGEITIQDEIWTKRASCEPSANCWWPERRSRTICTF